MFSSFKGHLMKRTQIHAVILALVILPITSFAASEHDVHAPMTHAQNAHMQTIQGTVKKVDGGKGRISVSHPAMNGMPGMTMIYMLKDPSWAQQITPGSHI